MSKFLSLFQGYRKWSIMLITLITGIVLLKHNLITGAEFVDLVKATGVGFMAANSFEHIKGMVSAKKEEKD